MVLIVPHLHFPSRALTNPPCCLRRSYPEAEPEAGIQRWLTLRRSDRSGNENILVLGWALNPVTDVLIRERHREIGDTETRGWGRGRDVKMEAEIGIV